MTILSTIRNRVGLLVGIIFLALLAFVLGDFLSSQHGLFGGRSSNDIGVINGHEISAVEFRNEIDALSNGENLNQEQQDQYSEGVWQDLIRRHIFEPQFKALGITVTEDELAEQMYGNNISPYMNQFFQNPQTGQIAPDFADPMTGQLSGQKVREFVGKMDAETETKWSRIEIDMRKVLLREKYNALLRKGFYATNNEVKHEYADENTKYNYKYIVKRYADVKDSTITPTTDELKDYYNNHKWKFKQTDAVRTIEYVAFNIMPSANDISEQKKAMEELVPKFKDQKPEQDSVFVLQNSESGMFTKTYMHPGQFPAGSDSAFIKANPGDVLGPFTNGESSTIYKVYGKKVSTDSVKVRHILIAYKGGERAGPEITRTKVEAKAKADSILRVVKSGKTKMEDIVEKTTDDPGSKPQGPGPGNKGDYGWFSEESGFVQEFKDAGFKNPKGATIVVETDFGYHVIQVLDKSSESTKVQVASIDKKIEPSEATMRDVYSKASEFSGKNNNTELFTAAVKKDNMSPFKADPIMENSKQINGVENPKELIRWLYDNKTEVGSVSHPFQNTDRYIVARVTGILERGTKPFEDETVQEICKVEAIKQKKADLFTEELNKAKGKTIEETAAKAGNIPVMPGTGITIAAPYMQGAAFEPGVVGTLTSLAPNTMSAPVKGTMGVYIVMLEKVEKPAAITPADAKAKQATIIAGLASRADASAEGILKDAAEIVDNRARYF
ncbi:MAG: SurA N-terminal domain-containing protein [Bacteroidia bacterium]